MNQENTLFSIFIELLVLSELHRELDEDDIGRSVESAAAEFEKQPREALARFVAHCRTLVALERERGAADRAQVIECVMAHYQESLGAPADGGGSGAGSGSISDADEDGNARADSESDGDGDGDGNSNITAALRASVSGAS